MVERAEGECVALSGLGVAQRLLDGLPAQALDAEEHRRRGRIRADLGDGMGLADSRCLDDAEGGRWG